VEFPFANNEKGIQRLLECVDVKCKAVIESTGNLWLRIYEALERHGVEVKLANPYKTKAIASARIKTDRLSARILAHVATSAHSMTRSSTTFFRGSRPMYRRRGLITDPFSTDLTLASLISTVPCLVSRVLSAVPALLNFLSPSLEYFSPHNWSTSPSWAFSSTDLMALFTFAWSRPLERLVMFKSPFISIVPWTDTIGFHLLLF